MNRRLGTPSVSMASQARQAFLRIAIFAFRASFYKPSIYKLQYSRPIKASCRLSTMTCLRYYANHPDGLNHSVSSTSRPKFEIRDQILDLLLTRGNVALTRMIERRYPHWNHRRPSWQLIKVNRQMRTEALRVLCSAKNTFFLPIGLIFEEVGGARSWILPYMIPPAIRRVHCFFEVGSVTEDSIATVETVKRSFEVHSPGETFEHLPNLRKQKWLHRIKNEGLISGWAVIANSLFQRDLDLLRLDITDYSCLTGYRRVWPAIMDSLKGYGFNENPAYSRRIEILGASESVQHQFKDAYEGLSDMAKGRVFWMNGSGCTVLARYVPLWLH